MEEDAWKAVMDTQPHGVTTQTQAALRVERVLPSPGSSWFKPDLFRTVCNLQVEILEGLSPPPLK